MEIIDNYHTIAASVEAEYKEKGSRFIAYAFPVSTEIEVVSRLEEIKALHFKASHHCYAYVLGVDRSQFRANDDGEPSGSAGRPILGQIHSFGLTNTLVIVVRYFGGTKLGVSGLITAYKEASRMVLAEAPVVQEFISDTFLLTFTYEHMGHILNVLKEQSLEMVAKEFTDKCYVSIKLRAGESSEGMRKLKARLLEVSLEYVDDETEVPICEIRQV